jgi:methyl-accepting chemotaxis protein
LSHSIAGALWGFVVWAKAVGGGDMAVRIHLREKDELRGLADQMNKMVETMGTRVKDINTTVMQLEEKVEILRAHLEHKEAAPEESLRMIKEIRHSTRTLISKLL